MWVRAGGRHAFLAIAVKICEFMPNSAAVAAAATTAARHSKVPWLKVSKELHMLLSHCLHVRVCVCVWRHFRFPHTLEGKSQAHHACTAATVCVCVCAILHAVVVALLLNLSLPLHARSLNPHAVNT